MMQQESSMNLERWSRLMNQWAFEQNQGTFDALMSSYTEKGRHYHTHEHVAACLYHLDNCVASAAQPREIELALWFHDAIYKPLSSRNEEKSAEWAASFLSDNGADDDEISRVHRLIMVTEHNAPTHSKDESLVVDIDLAILGAKPSTYDVFEENVRREYNLIPLFLYRKKRAEVLQGFLERDRIFQNEPFATDRELQAKENLKNAISKLFGRT